MWVLFSYALGSWAQAVSGFGFALITVPMLALVCDRIDAVIAQSVVGLVVTTLMAWQLRAEVDRVGVRNMLIPACLGMPVGLLIGRHVSDRLLRFLLGVLVIGFAVALAVGFRIRSKSRVVDGVAGVFSGILNMTTGTNGPPLVIAMTGRDTAPATMRANLQWLFMLSNLVGLTLFVASGELTRRGVLIGAIGIAPSFAVRRLGERMFRSLGSSRYRVIVLVLLGISGTLTLYRAWKP